MSWVCGRLAQPCKECATRPCPALQLTALVHHHGLSPVARQQVLHPSLRLIASAASVTSASSTPARRAQPPVPPVDYQFRADVQPGTVEVISTRYPQLMDLVDEGSLVVHRRPLEYKERRSDGYLEPELVFIIGTAHVSTKSAITVQRVIEAVKPQSVVVELCRSRSAVMYAPLQHQPQLPQQPNPTQVESTSLGSAITSTTRSLPASPQQANAEATHQQCINEQTQRSSTTSNSISDNDMAAQLAASPAGTQANTIAASVQQVNSQQRQRVNPLNLSGDSFMQAMQRSLALGGQSGLLLRVLLSGMAKRVAGGLGVTPGAEFAAARQSADAVGAQVVLGDRPIEITLQRAWAALSWRRQIQLCYSLLAAAWRPPPQALTAAMVERLQGDGEVSALFAQLATTYPELLSPLVHERDLYLAWSLTRSKAVNGVHNVVGVIGKGHVRGVVYALRDSGGSSGLRFADLVDGKNTSAGKKQRRIALARRLLLEAALGGAAYAVWVWYSGSASEIHTL